LTSTQIGILFRSDWVFYLKQDRNAEALAEAQKRVELSKREIYPLGVLGNIYAQTGKRSDGSARRIEGDLRKTVTSPPRLQSAEGEVWLARDGELDHQSC
jgi:hypothetical protein